MTSYTLPQRGKRIYKRHGKPPYSYMGMIAAILSEAPSHTLPLHSIYDTMEASFTFFKESSYTGWRDSVRHNLSQHACFVKAADCNKRKCLWHLRHDLMPAKMYRLQKPSRNKDYPADVRVCISAGRGDSCHNSKASSMETDRTEHAIIQDRPQKQRGCQQKNNLVEHSNGNDVENLLVKSNVNLDHNVSNDTLGQTASPQNTCPCSSNRFKNNFISPRNVHNPLLAFADIVLAYTQRDQLCDFFEK